MTTQVINSVNLGVSVLQYANDPASWEDASSGIGPYTTPTPNYVGSWVGGSYADLAAAFITFDTSVLPDGVAIDSAVLSGQGWTKSGAGLLEARLFSSWDRTLDASDWQTPAQANALPLLARVDLQLITNGVYLDWVSEPAFAGSIDPEGFTSLVLVGPGYAGGSGFTFGQGIFRGWSLGFPWKLTVDYHFVDYPEWMRSVDPVRQFGTTPQEVADWFANATLDDSTGAFDLQRKAYRWDVSFTRGTTASGRNSNARLFFHAAVLLSQPSIEGTYLYEYLLGKYGLPS